MALLSKTLNGVNRPKRWFLGWWCLALCVPLTAWSQTAYPQRPVKLIAPFPPGGTSDVLARVIAQKLGEGLGQPVTVDNKPGAGAILATSWWPRPRPMGTPWCCPTAAPW